MSSCCPPGIYRAGKFLGNSVFVGGKGVKRNVCFLQLKSFQQPLDKKGMVCYYNWARYVVAFQNSQQVVKKVLDKLWEMRYDIQAHLKRKR